MKATRRGGATVAIIAVIVLVVIALVTWYFVSDPFRTRVDSTAKELTQWTPEQIAKDPINYLNFCETQAKKAQDRLKVSEIAVRQSLATLENKHTETTRKVQNGEKGLGQMREVYQANTSRVWPVTWDGRSYTEDDFKLQARRFNREVASSKSLLTTLDEGIKVLNTQLTKIKEARVQADEQLANIESKREMLKVQAITDDLTKQLVAMKGMLQATVVTAEETSKVVSLDQYTAAADTKVSDTEFEKLMQKP